MEQMNENREKEAETRQLFAEEKEREKQLKIEKEIEK